MMYINYIIYYFFMVIILLGIIFFILKSQSNINNLIEDGMLIQPYSVKSLKKEQFVILVLLEAPIILTSVLIFFLYSIIGYQIPYFYILIFSYIFSVGLTSCFTIIKYNDGVKFFIKAFSAHPQKSSSFANKLILSLSLLQAPLIVVIVSIFVNIININNFLSINHNIISLENIFIASLSVFLVSIASVGAIIGIGKITESYAKKNIFYSISSEKNFINLILGIGLVEAPFIFSFITSLFILKIIFKITTYVIPIIFLTLAFAFVAFFTSYKSGLISAKGFDLVDENMNKNKILFSITILGQILLDARILYMFILLIIFLSRLNLL